MNSNRACLLGMLALALSAGCAKRHAVFMPSSPESHVVALASWVPQEAQVMVLLSPLEAWKASLEQVDTRSSLGLAKEALEARLKLKTLMDAWFQEVLLGGSPPEEEAKKAPDFFALSTWQEMGLNTQAPLAAGFGESGGSLVLPVVDHARFLAAIEKHLASKGGWEAQPGMPLGLHAWETSPGTFVVLAPKPGLALFQLGKDLEVLKQRTQLPKEESWAQHEDILLKIDSRLPLARLLSAWVRFDEAQLAQVEWAGAALALHPRLKVVVDVAWREGKRPFLPKMRAVPFEPEEWSQGLGEVVGAFWSSVEWDWYLQWLRRYASKDVGAGSIAIFSALLKHNLEPPLLVRGQPQTKEGGGSFVASIDVLLKTGGSIEQLLQALTPLVAAGELDAVPLGPDASAWKTQLGDREVVIQTLGQNRLRISDSAYNPAPAPPNALQEVVMREMTRYPLAAMFHLNALLGEPSLPRVFPESRLLEKAEYLLLGVYAEEDHAQLIGEHFVEADLP